MRRACGERARAHLQGWVAANKDNESRLAGIFNLSARIAKCARARTHVRGNARTHARARCRHIPDHAAVGAYSNSPIARIYREAADGLPRRAHPHARATHTYAGHPHTDTHTHTRRLLLMSIFGDSELARNMVRRACNHETLARTQST